MANAARNEQSVELNGVTYYVRPTFEAISRIEGSLDKGVMALGNSILQGDVRVSHMAVILHHMLATDKAHKAPSPKDIGEFLAEEGVEELMGPCARFCLEAFRGSNKAKKVANQGEEESETL